SVSPEQSEFFEAKVRPVLADNCFGCHGEKKQMGGLRLDSREAILQGGDNGPALVPGKPERSDFLRAVRHDGPLKMPPKSKLPAEAVAVLTEWVKRGAPWPANQAPKPAEAGKKHGAFQPVKAPAVPTADDPIDSLVRGKLHKKQLPPNPPADRRTLIRRLYF